MIQKFGIVNGVFFLVVFVVQLVIPGRASALSVNVNIPEKYSQVAPGERVYFDVEVKYPENPSRKDIKLDYKIKRGSELIAESKVLKAIETQASFLDYIVIPEDAKSGTYQVDIQILDYEALNESVSATFYVTEQNNIIQWYFFGAIGVIIIFCVVIMIEIMHLRKVIEITPRR